MSDVSAEDQMKNANPDEMKKGMEPWMAWFQKVGTAIVDQGAPLGNDMHVTKAGSSKAKAHIGGYSILQAEDMEAVQVLLADHPHFMMDGGIQLKYWN